MTASTHQDWAYPGRDGQAELAWVAGYIPRWYTHPIQHRAITKTSWTQDDSIYRANIASHSKNKMIQLVRNSQLVIVA